MSAWKEGRLAWEWLEWRCYQLVLLWHAQQGLCDWGWKQEVLGSGHYGGGSVSRLAAQSSGSGFPEGVRRSRP